MESNFFIMLFFTIGIVFSIRVIGKSYAELRIYWHSRDWINKKDFVDSYLLLKAQGINVYDIVDDYYMDIDSRMDEMPGEAWEIESNDAIAIQEKCEREQSNENDDYISVELFVFRNEKKAEKCKQVLGSNCISIYDIEKKFYMMVVDGANEKYIKGFGGKVLIGKERNRIFDIIVQENSMVFEFKDPQMASFFVHKFDIQNLIAADGHLFVDMSSFSEEQAQKIRFVAAECYGEEVTDGFLIKQIKEKGKEIE